MKIYVAKVIEEVVRSNVYDRTCEVINVPPHVVEYEVRREIQESPYERRVVYLFISDEPFVITMQETEESINGENDRVFYVKSVPIDSDSIETKELELEV